MTTTVQQQAESLTGINGTIRHSIELCKTIVNAKVFCTFSEEVIVSVLAVAR